MKALQTYWREYHPVVHLLMAGTVLVMLTSSMSMPFLAIYLSETTSLDVVTIGLIIGAGPLAGTVGGFVGGLLSDLLGRKRLMLISMLAMSATYACFVFTTNPLLLLAVSLLRGVSGAFFATISKALIGDLTPEEKRFRVFANRYMAVNLGLSVGPMVGAFLGIAGSSIAFLLTAGIYLLYTVVLAVAYRPHVTATGSGGGKAEEAVTVGRIWQVLRKDVVLLQFILGSVLLVTVHGQMSVTLSQYLNENLADGVTLFGVLMSVNGATVLLAQVPLTRWSERFSLFQRIAMGSTLFAMGEIGFACSTGWTSFIVSMVVFTLGEILVIPAEYAQIDQITPQGMRGTYYGAQSFSELGNFLGPWAGGLILVTFGGPSMFLTMAAIALASLVFFRLGNQMHQKQKTAVQAVQP